MRNDRKQLALVIPQSGWAELQHAPADIVAAMARHENWYTPSPVSRSVPRTQKRELAQEYWCIVAGVVIRIETGYQWDGASIPRWAWFFVGQPFDPRHEAAGLIHDVLYGGELCDRDVADWVLHKVIRRTRGYAQGMHANVFWAAVRTGGWWRWFTKTDAGVQAQRKLLTWWSREFVRQVITDRESKQDQVEGMST